VASVTCVIATVTMYSDCVKMKNVQFQVLQYTGTSVTVYIIVTGVTVYVALQCTVAGVTVYRGRSYSKQ
jgi:hypothetical protein